MLLTALSASSLAIWIYLLTARSYFWRVERNRISTAKSEPVPARIVAVIPARDEAETIGRAVRSLLDQQVSLRVIVVDDASSDSTADNARASGAEVFHSAPLPPLWTGKLWALSQGIECALAYQPDYLLLTDADIFHESQSVRYLLAVAEEKDCDLASLMVKLECTSLAEKALIPAFVFFFLQLYPPAWIEHAQKKTAGAAGGCMLVRPSALARIGGIAAIRSEVIDDCALARSIKRSGGRIWMGLTDKAHSVRPYRTFAEIERMIARTAFNQLRHSALLLLGTVAALLLTYVVPVIALCAHQRVSCVLGAAAWMLMASMYLPLVRFYRIRWFWALTLPAVALFYLGATVHSAVQYWRGRGGSWKGRAQDTL